MPHANHSAAIYATGAISGFVPNDDVPCMNAAVIRLGLPTGRKVLEARWEEMEGGGYLNKDCDGLWALRKSSCHVCAKSDTLRVNNTTLSASDAAMSADVVGPVDRVFGANRSIAERRCSRTPRASTSVAETTFRELQRAAEEEDRGCVDRGALVDEGY